MSNTDRNLEKIVKGKVTQLPLRGNREYVTLASAIRNFLQESNEKEFVPKTRIEEMISTMYKKSTDPEAKDGTKAYKELVKGGFGAYERILIQDNPIEALFAALPDEIASALIPLLLEAGAQEADYEVVEADDSNKSQTDGEK